MKFFFVIFALLSTQTLYVVNAKQYIFQNIRTQAVISPENSVLTVEHYATTQYKYNQPVEKLLINVTVTYEGSGKVLYNGQLVNICDNQEADSWANAAVKIFKILIVPRKGRGAPTCPIKPTGGIVADAYDPIAISLSDKLDSGFYEYAYSAQANDDTVILSSMILTMSLD